MVSNIYLASGATENVDATYNWWGTTDPQAINQSMYDFYDDFNLGKVNFVPFLDAPNSAAPTIPTPSPSPSPAPTPTPTPTSTPTPTPEPTPAPTQAATPTPTPKPTASPTPAPTSTPTPTTTPLPSPTPVPAAALPPEAYYAIAAVAIATIATAGAVIIKKQKK